MTKDLIVLKVTKAFKRFSGVSHGTVRCIAEVRLTLKFPVIYLVFFEEDQSEVRLNSRDALKILDV